MKIARAAIDMLIEGVPHENVFAFLDKKKKGLRGYDQLLLLISSFYPRSTVHFMADFVV